jgi:hypothetical protein
MTDYSFYSLSVRPDVLVDALIKLANSPKPLNYGDIEDIVDMSENYVRAVIRVGTQLGVIQERRDGYVVDPSIEEEVRKLNPEQGFVVINRYVQRYKPFMTFLSFLDKGYGADQSAQSVVTLFDIDGKPRIIESQFLKLGRYADLLTDDDPPKPTVDVETLPMSYIEDLEGALKSEAKARLFVQERLGADVVAYVDDEMIEKLQDALLKHGPSPDNAIVDAVVAAESITREIAEEFGSGDVDYSNAGGIGSLAKSMRREEMILKRHLHGANYLGGMRNPGAHGKEAETLELWEVESEVALEVVLAAVNYVRSIYWFVTEERQIL